ncbi:MAG: hydrogenase nickel incorporation protein HypB [Anaerolineae bacterium]|nr:hydrogenase nickel incorporation protein HypB [Anaerolineae bacterium]
MAKVKVVEQVLKANDQIAAQNRALLDDRNTLAVNVMASPGAGKTSLLMRTIEALRGRVRVGAIEGDTASQVDADRVATTGVPVIQINTGGGCRLDANMMRPALEQLPLEEIDLLLIENVGNLVCPAGLALGEHVGVVVASVPEGDDKPYKYPAIFVAVDAVVINKTDLLPYLDFDVAAFRQLVAGLNPKARIFQVSCKTGEGIDEWAGWLAEMCTRP